MLTFAGADSASSMAEVAKNVNALVTAAVVVAIQSSLIDAA